MELGAEGLGYRRISQRLNDEGVLTPRGKKWFPSTVYSLIKKRRVRDARLNETPEYEFSDWALYFLEKTVLPEAG
ncbi:MAG: recombinase family protein [Myxococcota bacterium]